MRVIKVMVEGVGDWGDAGGPLETAFEFASTLNVFQANVSRSREISHSSRQGWVHLLSQIRSNIGSLKMGSPERIRLETEVGTKLKTMLTQYSFDDESIVDLANFVEDLRVL